MKPSSLSLRPSFLAAAVLGLCALIAMAAAHTLQRGDNLRDFAAFVEAGRAYEDGLNPYVFYKHPDLEAGTALGTPLETGSPNLNPPISIYPFVLMADADPLAVRDGLGVVSALIYAGVCVLLLKAYAWQRRPLIMLWLLAVAGFWYTLLLGQIYIPLFALGLGALLLIERGRNLLWAGALVGLVVAIKPNFGIWPLLLLLAGHRRLGLTAFAVAAAVSAVPLLIEGPEIYSQWLDAARAYPRAAIASNASMFGVATRLGVPQAGYAVAVAAIGAGAFYARRLRLTAREASAWSVMLTLFVGPLTWVGYTLFMLPLLLSRRWARWEVAVAATMLVPAGLGWPAGELRLAGIVMLSGLVLNDTLRARRARAEMPMEERTIVAAGQAA
jgi:hypothetical protein